MRMRRLVLAAVVSFAVGGVGQATDLVKTMKTSFSGRVVSMSPVQVELELATGGGTTKEIPVNQIQTIYFDGEPSELKRARDYIIQSRYADAQTPLEQIKDVALWKIKDHARKQEVQQDIEYYKAFCTAKLALGGSGKIAEAGPLMKAFADSNTKSYHYFEASELVGDLLAAVGQYGPAMEYYARLEKAPWLDYKMRAGVAMGRTLLAQGKIDDAQTAFDKVIAMQADGELARGQRALAKVGKACALVAAKKTDEAIKLADEILKSADEEDPLVLARAYNAIGTAHRQAGDTKRALLAFLHVELFYPSVSDAHAEALANLAELWEQDRKSERANRARKTLEEQYRDSPWAKKGREERGGR